MLGGSGPTKIRSPVRRGLDSRCYKSELARGRELQNKVLQRDPGLLIRAS